MSELWVELSGENRGLARAELEGAVAALGGSIVPEGSAPSALAIVSVPEPPGALGLAERLGLARRILRPCPASGDRRGEADWVAGIGGPPKTAAFRSLGSAGATPSKEIVDPWVRAWKASGGRLDLERPAHLFLYDPGPPPRLLGSVAASVDRAALRRRRTPNLPYRRPVTLAPRLARALVNLARIRSDDLVVDPFVGTGALLLEAALLGARTVGIDRDPEMVRGTLRNFAHLHLDPLAVRVGDAAEAAVDYPEGSLAALVTDPPYGRASGTGGEEPAELLARTLQAWESRIAPGGRIALVVPGGTDPLPSPWTLELQVRDRVHRSLTREFRVYARRSTARSTVGPSSR